MATLLDLVKIIKPQLAESEQIKMSDRIDLSASEYYPETWEKIQLPDLLVDSVHDNLIRTIFQLQTGYYGIVDEILNNLLDWTSGTIVFNNFSEEENDFYQCIFALLGFQNFAFVKTTTQLYLLGSRFLLLAPSLGVNIITNVRLHFANYCSINILETESKAFAAAIKSNQTLLANKTVANWIELYSNTQKNINDFTSEHFKEQKIYNTFLNRELARVVLTLANELISGSIWKDLEGSLCFHGYDEHQNQQKKIVIDPNNLYLDKLRSNPKISVWLQDAEEIALWMQNKTDDFIKNIFLILSDKVDLSDDVQIQDLYRLINVLAEKNKKFADVISFHESTSQFHWNSELLS